MTKKRILIAALAAAAILAGWQISQRSLPGDRPSAPTRTPSVAVEVRPVARGLVRDVGVYSGSLLPASQFIVAPKVAGKLEKIFVDIGDTVQSGQLVAVLDDDEYLQQVEQAQAELEVARASIEENRSALNLTRREFERAQALRAKGILSEAELDAAEAQYKAAQARQKLAGAQVAQKEAALESCRVRLDYTRIRAVWNDARLPRTVAERFVDEGAMLPANAPIVSIIDLSGLKAIIHVIEKDYPRLMAGQAARITTDAYPGRVFEGRVERIAPLLKETARQARVEITLDNPGLVLKPGMFVRVEIEYDRHEDTTVVPINSLIISAGQASVFLADLTTRRATRVPVTVGIVEGELAEIVSPSLSGFVVIVGQHLLQDGAAIVLPAPEGAPRKSGAEIP